MKTRKWIQNICLASPFAPQVHTKLRHFPLRMILSYKIHMKKKIFFVEMTHINNKSLYHLEEIRGVYIGRCYMLCFLKKVAEMEQVYVVLLKNKDILGKYLKSNFLFYIAVSNTCN